ncbi:MAG: MFS transporter, partial [Anaerolineae bacterium]
FSTVVKTFIIVWIGQLVSTLGSALTSFALGVWVYETTGSPTLYAVTLVVHTLPRIGLSPVAGVIADRWDRRRVMILSDTGAGLSSLFVIVMLLTGRLEVWHVYLSTLFNSAFSTFQWPAYSAATSLLVPKRHLGRAGGLTQIGDAISQLASPAIAGALFVISGLRAVLLVDVATYLIALMTLLLVRFPRPKTTDAGREAAGSFWQEAVYGWTYIRGRAGLFGLLATFAVMNFVISITFALYTPLILGLTTPDVLGYLNSVGGLGMLVGTLIMSAWGGPKRRIYGIFVAEMVLGITTLLFGLRLSIPLMAINNFVFLLAMPITNVCSQAIWQTKVAPDIQGRVFAIRRMIAFSIMPLAYAIAGPLAEHLFEPWMAADGALATSLGPLMGTGPGHGIALIFVLAGAIYMLLVLSLLIRPRIRRLELEIPDAIEDGEADNAASVVT